jgi:FkbH-like protein
VLKLIEALKIVESQQDTGPRRLDVFLVAGFTPLHLKTFLEAYLRLRSPDRQVQVRLGQYGDVSGNLERAANAAPDAVAITLEWPDFDPRLGIRAASGSAPTYDDLRESMSRRSRRIQEIIEQRLEQTPIALSLPTIPARPICSHPGWLVNPLDTVLLKCSADFAQWASERKHIRLLNSARLDAMSPPNVRWDARSELAADFPYQLNHASVLSSLLSQLIRPPAPKKGLITDLDDTLWNGIVGEVGVDGISWSLDRHSHHHGLYQQQLSALASAGTLLAIASKNDPAVVRQALDRSDFLLGASHIFPVEVSWGPKSSAVQRILKAWNIGADSVVFVDDSPMELAEVHAAFPEIECLLFPKQDTKACIDMLDQIRDMFGKHVVTEEDTLRAASLRSQAVLPKDFLEDAEAEITFSTVKDASDARPLELINKTNQFNLNGRRYTESEWLNYLRNPKSQLLLAAYKDKYGQLGKIAVLGGRSDNSAFSVDFWVMSCRAFSRRIEHQCLRHLFTKFGISQISFDFTPTPRNTPMQEFATELLGAKPNGPFVVPQAAFEEKCPPLFHSIKDTKS